MAYDDRDDEADDIDIRRRREDVPNYLVQSILITLCCCLPFGIVAIVNASKVNSHLARGEYAQAVKASEEAKKWCWIGFFLGIIANGLYVFIQIAAEGPGLFR